MNDQLVSNNGDILRNKPIVVPNKLKLLDSVGSFVMGFCPHTGNYFKGKIGEIKVYDNYFKSYDDIDDRDLVFSHDFKPDPMTIQNDVEYSKEKIDIVKTILPHRRGGSFYCLPHQDEGFVNGTWFKGETTARNEKRFVTKMQQKEIDYKKDGINSVKYELVETVDYSPNCKMFNVKL